MEIQSNTFNCQLSIVNCQLAGNNPKYLKYA
ncbi:hypothetical protein M2133_002228 [Parabacteroides sp. PF5-6]|nr:hypothetical protein [Parabacteroides sp. PF5-6]